MKKIISLILSFILMMGTFCTVSAQNVPTVNLKNEHKALMSAIGCYKEGDDLGVKLTRSQFADLLVKSIYKEPQYLTDNTSTFNDVLSDNPYYASINLLKALEVTLGDGNGNFKPDEEIMVNDAVVMTVRFLGYKLYADKKGYLVVASEKGLLNHLSFEHNEILNQGQALILIYNMLNADISDQQYSSSAASRLMSAHRALFIVKGVVTDDGIISENGMSKLGTDNIIINGMCFKNETGKKGLFGNEVVGSYIISEGKSILKSVYITESDNTLVINSDDIIDFDIYKHEYIYYEDDEKESEVQFPFGITIIYNGVPVTADTDTEDVNFKPSEGNIILKDTDKDNKYDLLYINSYKTMVVSNADVTKSIIYSKTGGSIDVRNKEYAITDKNGQTVKVSEIKENDVITVVESLNKKVYTLYVSDEIVNAVGTGFDTGNKTLLLDDGTEVMLTDTFVEYTAKNMGISKDENREYKILQNLSKGNMLALFLDVNGKVAWVEESASFQYGYLVLATDDSRSALQKNIYLKIYIPSEGMKDLKMTEKVTFRDDRGNPDQKIKEEDMVTKLKDFCGGVTNYNRFIAYKTNADGLINEIELPLDVDVNTANMSGHRLFVINDGGTFYNVNSGALSGGVLFSNIKKVVVPSFKNSLDEKEYTTQSYSRIMVNDTENSYIAYGTNPQRYSKPEYVVMKWADFQAPTFKSYMVVSKVLKCYDYDKDESYYKIDGYTAPLTSTTYFVKEEHINNVVEKIKGIDGEEYKLSAGDVINFAVSNKYTDKRYIKTAYLMYDADQPNGNYGETGRLIGSKGDTLSSYNPAIFSTTGDTLDAEGNIVKGTITQNKTVNVKGINIRATVGYVYDKYEGTVTLTTQPLKKDDYMYNSAEDGYRNPAGNYLTEVYPDEVGMILVNVSKDGKVNITTAKDYKDFKTYGAECDKVVWATRLYPQFVCCYRYN